MDWVSDNAWVKRCTVTRSGKANPAQLNELLKKKLAG
jgi:hypothetical protein